jgi:hypothetical protein
MSTTYSQSSEPTGGPERLKDTAKDLASSAADTVRQEAASFADRAKETVGERAGQAQSAASQTLGDFASAVRKAGDELAQSDQSMAGRLVQQAANGLEQVSRSLADKQPGELIDAVRDFGRSNPIAFIGGAVLIGIALGRFARTSAPQGAGMSSYGGVGGYTGSGGGYQTPGYAGAASDQARFEPASPDAASTGSGSGYGGASSSTSAG